MTTQVNILKHDNCCIYPQVFQYVDSLVPTVRRTLCDPLPEVRRAAAKTFDNLYSTIGAKALDEILTDLLDKMVIYSVIMHLFIE